jgi:hypothetical protein
VGICKACNRGLCSDCATEVPSGLACPGRCEKVARSSDISLLLSQGSLRYLVLGAVFFGHGLYADLTFGLVLGGALLALGAILLARGWRARVAA